ncbi:MAG: hypothetical protein K0041_05235 [Acidithiobacillus sp.]|nr:hypothetical protein [Acidithiobacillus sp.]
MGCDIHITVEKKIDEEWVMIHTPTWQSDVACERNYRRFAALAGVRGDGPPAKGLPSDVSKGTEYRFAAWGDDAHSPSYNTLREFLDVCERTKYDDVDRSKWSIYCLCEHYLGSYWEITDQNPDDFRVVYWFDS